MHWLPIAYRIRFKLFNAMHTVNNGTSLDKITPISSLFPGHRRHLSVSTNRYEIPRTWSKFGEFSVAGLQ